MIIKNGVGDGTLAIVHPNNHIGTQSIAEPLMGYKSRVDEQAFSIFSPIAWPVTGTETRVLVVINNESEKSFLVNLFFVSHSGGTTFNRSIYAKMYKGVTAPTTGILTGAAIPFGNLNMGSTKVTSVVAYLWDGSTGTGLSGGSAGSIAMNGVFSPGFTEVPLNGTVILSPGQSFAVSYQNLESAITYCCCTISGFLAIKGQI